MVHDAVGSEQIGRGKNGMDKDMDQLEKQGLLSPVPSKQDSTKPVTQKDKFFSFLARPVTFTFAFRLPWPLVKNGCHPLTFIATIIGYGVIFYTLGAYALKRRPSIENFSRGSSRSAAAELQKSHSPPSSPGIFWSPCPDDSTTFCSYLSVPMEYHGDPQADAQTLDSTASIALRMIPATAPIKDQLGYLLVNPGGPSGSGHQFALRRGRELSTIVSHRYHIIGFDPRGVNLTSPAHGCFSSQGEANRFQRDFESLGLPGQTKAIKRRTSGESRGESEIRIVSERTGRWQSHADSYYEAFDRACRQNGNQKVLETSSTAIVARDMKSIIDALGQEKLHYCTGEDCQNTT